MQDIGRSAQSQLRSLDSDALVRELLNMRDYHGFSKSRLPPEFLSSILEPFGVTASDVQLEVVMVDRDMSHEVHVHNEANAFVIILGSEEHLPDPSHGECYLNEGWSPVTVSQEINIPAGTKHGFRSEGGVIWFLSTQGPPIERSGGHDDYHRVEA